MNKGFHVLVLPAPRAHRTPESDVTMIMSNLSKFFLRYINPEGTTEEFMQNYFHNLMACEFISADEFAQDYIEMVNKTPKERDTGMEFLYALHIPCLYCVQAKRADNAGNRDEAWSFISDAQYWAGILLQSTYSRVSVEGALSSRSRAGAMARTAKFEPLRELARKMATERQYPSMRNAALTIAPIIVAKSKEIGLHMSQSQAESTIKSWLKGMRFGGKPNT